MVTARMPKSVLKIWFCKKVVIAWVFDVFSRIGASTDKIAHH